MSTQIFTYDSIRAEHGEAWIATDIIHDDDIHGIDTVVTAGGKIKTRII
jgi:hypothetical protein